MKANERPSNYERPYDNYEKFEEIVFRHFNSVVAHTKQLYQVKVDGLWDLYLNNLPEDGRFVYDCRTCRHFVERYGNLVVINENGVIESALWNLSGVPEYFADSVAAMNYAVINAAKVSNVFISDIQNLGTGRTGIWTHLSVVLPHNMVNTSRTKNASQLMAEKREDFNMLLNALNEYPINVVEQAVALLQTNAMYRSDRVLGVAEWFLKVHNSLMKNSMTAARKTNLIWKAVGEAPNGYCHVKSSMIGTLLDDIAAGYSTRVIMARFEEKMNPQNYMRSQSAPTASAIEQAEKLVEKLGIADSLRRRYARFEEVIDKMMWMPKADVIDIPAKGVKTGGVFANVVPKDRPVQNDISLDLPVTTMTWDKFARTILPGASKIEAKVENPNRFMALVTEAVPGSESILQWNNPFSWYYHGGIDGEIKRRVEAAGGRYENCEIRCSLIWENYTDLDLHCVTPRREHIYYGDKHDMCGGYLDVDANGGRATTTKPVENIRWADHAPNGYYEFFVHNYCDRNHRDNPYRVELEVGGKIYTCDGFMAGTNEKHTVFEFDYRNGVVENLRCGNQVSVSGSDMWGLTVGDFVEVKGILRSPNMWDEKSGSTNGDHMFFILDGCKDTSEGLGRGFFNEILKPELREIRKTLEVYSANTPIECVDEADACGIGFSKDSEWNVVLKVTGASGVRLIKIDRFD